MDGFVRLMRTVETHELLRDANAFTLLALIALRAKRTEGFDLDGLEVGEAKIGDHESAGLSRQEYRTALARLEKYGFLTTKPTNSGTIVRLANGAVWNINAAAANHQTNQQPTSNQPATNQQPTTNKNERMKEKKENTEKSSLQSDSCPDPEVPRPASRAKRISFDYETSEFVGILPADIEEWQKAYPAVDIKAQLLRAKQWLIDNPAKRKKLVSNYLSKWFGRDQEKGGSIPSNKPTKDAVKDAWKPETRR